MALTNHLREQAKLNLLNHQANTAALYRYRLISQVEMINIGISDIQQKLLMDIPR